MTVFLNVLLFLHLIGLVIGMGSGMAISAASRFTTVTKPASGFDALFSMLARNGHIGLGMLWVTGLLLVWFKYQGFAAFGAWFWVKIALVVVLSASVGIGPAAMRRAQAGDENAAGRAKMASMVSGLSGFAIVFAAVFAFN